MEHETNNKKISMSEQVLQKIHAHELTMRPRMYFTLRTIALVVFAFLAFTLTISLGSFILFSIRASHQISLLGFGPSGYLIFIKLFPWPLAILDIIFLVALERILRTFRFGYRSPLLYLLVGILGLSLAVSIFIDRGHLSDSLLHSARDYNLPFVRHFYDHGRRPPSIENGVCPCSIVSATGTVVTANEFIPGEQPRQIDIYLPADVATSTMRQGDRYFIIGEYTGGILHASHIREMDGDIDEDSPIPPPPLR